MTRAMQVAVLVGALGCGALARPIDGADRQVGRETSGESLSAAAATIRRPESANRDPFVRPVLTPPGRPVDVNAAGDGLAAASYGEIVVRGVVQTRGDRVALVQTPDGKHYQVRAGQRLRDGRVQAVGTEGLVIVPDTSAGGERAPGPVRKSVGIGSKAQ